MRLLIPALLALPAVLGLNIMMYVIVPGKSHIQFAEKIIALLHAHGHSVDLVLGMLNSELALTGTHGARKTVKVQFPGVSPWNTAKHLTDPFEEKSDWSRMTDELSSMQSHAAMLCDLVLDSAEVDDLLTSNKYDLALISGYDLCPFGLAHHYRISPVVSYVPTPAFTVQYYYAGLPELPLYESVAFEASHEDRLSFSQRIYESLRIFKERYLHSQVHPVITSKFRARYGAGFPDIRDIMRNISIDFSNSHPLLEEPKPISLRLRYIGGVGHPVPKPLSKELNDLLDSTEKGTVIFSFGTQVAPETISETMQRVFANTFKRFPEYNFLWKLDGKTRTNASNVYNMQWLPQTDLLHDSRVVAFISHMGLNSFIETSFAGVPVVSIPLFADQVHNARRAKALGMGEIVRKTEITEDNLTAALEKVLFDNRYRLRAREVSAMIKALPDTPQRIFLEGIEFAAKFENLPSHYRLEGASHNVIVQLGWDVAAFFTVLILLFGFLLTKLLVFISCKFLPVTTPGMYKPIR